jgi:hypothetical protein
MKSFRTLLAAFAIAALLLPATASARSLEDKEKAALATTVAEFDAAMKANNFERIIQTVPPKVINSIATKAGIKVEQLMPMMTAIMKGAMEKVKLESFGMDLAKAEYKETANGTPYVLIPTTTVMSAPEIGKIQQKSHSLGIIDEGKWYLIRVSEAQQIIILREVYPEFTGVEFPSGSTEALQ